MGQGIATEKEMVKIVGLRRQIKPSSFILSSLNRLALISFKQNQRGLSLSCEYGHYDGALDFSKRKIKEKRNVRLDVWTTERVNQHITTQMNEKQGKNLPFLKKKKD